MINLKHFVQRKRKGERQTEGKKGGGGGEGGARGREGKEAGGVGQRRGVERDHI